MRKKFYKFGSMSLSLHNKSISEDKIISDNLNHFREGLNQIENVLKTNGYSIEQTNALIEHMGIISERIEQARSKFLQLPHSGIQNFSLMAFHQQREKLESKIQQIIIRCLTKTNTPIDSFFFPKKGLGAHKEEIIINRQPSKKMRKFPIQFNGCFPADIFREIFSSLYKFSELMSLRRVCQTFKALSEERLIALYASSNEATSFQAIIKTRRALCNSLKDFCAIRSFPLHLTKRVFPLKYFLVNAKKRRLLISQQIHREGTTIEFWNVHKGNRIHFMHLKAWSPHYQTESFLLVKQCKMGCEYPQLMIWDLEALMEGKPFELLFPNSFPYNANLSQLKLYRWSEETLLLFDSSTFIAIDLKTRCQKSTITSWPTKYFSRHGPYVSYKKNEDTVTILKIEKDCLSPILSKWNWRKKEFDSLLIFSNGLVLIHHIDIHTDSVIIYDLNSIVNNQPSCIENFLLNKFFTYDATAKCHADLCWGFDCAFLYCNKEFLMLEFHPDKEKKVAILSAKIPLPNPDKKDPIISPDGYRFYLKDDCNQVYYFDRIAFRNNDAHYFFGPIDEENIYVAKNIIPLEDTPDEFALRDFYAIPNTLTPKRARKEAVKLLGQVSEQLLQSILNKYNEDQKNQLLQLKTINELLDCLDKMRKSPLAANHEVAQHLADLTLFDLEKNTKKILRDSARLLNSQFPDKISLFRALESPERMFYFELTQLKKILDIPLVSVTALRTCVENLSCYDDYLRPFLKNAPLLTGYPLTSLKSIENHLNPSNSYVIFSLREYLDYYLIEPSWPTVIKEKDRVALEKLYSMCKTAQPEEIFEQLSLLHSALERAIILKLNKVIYPSVEEEMPEKYVQITISSIYSYTSPNKRKAPMEICFDSTFFASLGNAIKELLSN